MPAQRARRIRITQADCERLQRLIEARHGGYRRDQEHLAALAEELERAEIVDAAVVPSDVVTMQSRVRVRDVATGEEMVYTLVFPNDADLAEGRLSVLAPIGTALLGYREGDVIEWEVPGGIRTLKVAKVLFQPEAAAAAFRGRRRQSADAVEG